MTRFSKILGTLALTSGLVLAGAATYAQPGFEGHGKGPGMMGGMPGGMEHQLMTPQERTAFREKMQNAKTPEERQKIGQEAHTQMQQRANEKGISLPEAGETPPATPGTGTSPK